MAEIAKMGTYGGDLQRPLEPPAARASVLVLVGLWPKTIKLNPS